MPYDKRKRTYVMPRWRVQFSVRTMLIVMALCAVTVWLGSRWSKAQRQKLVVGILTADTYPDGQPRSTITYDFQRHGDSAPRLAPKWLVDIVGVDFFADVVGLHWRSQQLPEQRGAAGLAMLSDLPELEVLSPPLSGVTDRDLVLLNGHKKLRVLDLSFSKITGTGFKEAAYGDHLRSLSLRGCPVSDEGLAVISGLERLEELDLSTGGFPPAPFSHEGLASLADLRRLKKLQLAGIDVTDTDLAEIAKLRSLEYLAVSPGKATGVGIMRLRVLTELNCLDLEGSEPIYIPGGRLEHVLEALADCVESGDWRAFKRAKTTWTHSAVETRAPPK